jgi:hypothetical protein
MSLAGIYLISRLICYYVPDCGQMVGEVKDRELGVSLLLAAPRVTCRPCSSQLDTDRASLFFL